MRRLLAAALCAMVKGQNSSCGPVRASYDHAGFGNAFDVLFVAFDWARRCDSRVEIVGDKLDRLRRICERLTCAGASAAADGTDQAVCPPGCPAPLMTWKQTPSSVGRTKNRRRPVLRKTAPPGGRGSRARSKRAASEAATFTSPRITPLRGMRWRITSRRETRRLATCRARPDTRPTTRLAPTTIKR